MRSSKHRSEISFYKLLTCTVLPVLIYLSVPALQGAQAASVAIDIADEEKISLSVRAVPLQDVLTELAEKSKIDFKVLGNVEETVTIELSNVSIEEAIKRLLASYSYSLIYSSDSIGGRGPHIEKVLIYSSKQNMSDRDRSDPRESHIRFSQQETDSIDPVSETESSENTADIVSLETYGNQLKSPDPDVREDAVYDMTEDHSEAALEYLENVLINDSNANVRLSAAESIGELGSEDGIKSLALGIKDSNREVREAVVMALGEIGGEKTLPALRQALQDNDPDIREEAQSLIEDIVDSN